MSPIGGATSASGGVASVVGSTAAAISGTLAGLSPAKAPTGEATRATGGARGSNGAPVDLTSRAGARRTRLPRIAGAIQISDRVRAALEAGYPLTVLRAARGFGKTSVLVAWLRTTADDTATIYHTLDQRSNTAAEFWRVLATALANADIELTPTEADPRRQVIDAIAALTRPLRLVLDNMHEAGLSEGAAAIDEDLVEMIRSNDQFYLVVAGRNTREVESTGSLSVDAAVIGPEDLKFSADRLVALARDLDVHVAPSCAQQIVGDLGGWPAAIRAGLTNAAPESVVDAARVAGYLGTVLRDMRTHVVRSFFLRTAVPEEFDAALAAAIMPEEEAAGRALHRIRTAGMLRQRQGPNGLIYSYPPAIRSALLKVLRESEPELEVEVHRQLMIAAASRHDPAQVVRHGVAAGEWDTVAEVVERHWVPLLTIDPAVVVHAAQRAPEALVAQDPRLRVARTHVAAITDPAMKPEVLWPVMDHPTMAGEIAARADRADQVVDAEGLALVLWGVACLMAGSHDVATYAFNQARAQGLRDQSTSALVIGTVGLGLVHALHGEPDLAQKWLDEPELEAALLDGDVPEDRDVVTSAAWVARALVAIDQGSPEAEQAVTAMVNPRHRGDLWAMNIFVRAHHAAVGDDPEEVFRHTNQVRAALRHVARGTLAETVLISTLVELLLFARMSGVALEAAAHLSNDPIGWTTYAKVYLARHNFPAAIENATKAVDATQISQRSRLESWVIMAAAHHAQNEHALARRAFTTAAGLSQATGQRRPFYLMQRYVFDILAGDEPALLRLWPGRSAVQATLRADPDLEMPTLTMREAQVLRALERHAGPVGISRSMGVSVNTVKTHLRTIYRKLGVSSRNEALEMVGRTGLTLIDDT